MASGSNVGGGPPRPASRESKPSSSGSDRSILRSSLKKAADMGAAEQQREAFRAMEERKKVNKKAAREMGVSLVRYEEMQEVFKLFDADGSGSIDPKEIRTQMSSLGFEVDNTTIYQLISDLDSDGSQQIEFEEFAGLLKDDLRFYHPDSTSKERCEEVFDFLDDLDPEERDAKIETENLRRVAEVLGDNITDEELEVMIACADKGGKGYVDCEDYYELMVGISRKMEENHDIPESDVSGGDHDKEASVS